MEEEKTSDLYEKLKRVDNPQSLDDYLRSIDDDKYVSLSDHLSQLLVDKKISMPELITASCIERSYCYQIFNGRKRPGRDKLIAIALGMKLTVNEAQRVLEIAKEGILYSKSKRDSIVIYAINNKMSIMNTNALLKQYDEKELE